MTDKEKLEIYRTLFKGRQDVFAKIWKNKSGRSGYSPACSNKFVAGVCDLKKGLRCDTCPNQKFIPLTDEAITAHFKGRQLVGAYPLLPDNTCWFIAIDFDKHTETDPRDPLEDAKEFMEVCKVEGISAYLERSKSGKGYHTWIFFAGPIPAWKARLVTFALLKEAQAIGEDDATSFDRMFPNQDALSGKGLGNLIALPLYGRAFKNGNSTFLDENLNPIGEKDIWTFLKNIQRTSEVQLDQIIKEWGLKRNESVIQGQRLTKEDWHRMLKEGERNNELTRHAGSLLLKMDIKDAYPMLLAWNNDHCDPPLDDNEVRIILESIAGKETSKQKMAKIKSFSEDELILSNDQLSMIEQQIKAIAKDTPIIKLPQALDPLLHEMASINIAQADAILRTIIKEHFGLTNNELKSYEKVLKSYRIKGKESDSKSLKKPILIKLLSEEMENKFVHPAQDFSKGLMTYAIRAKGIPCLITSDKRLFIFSDAEEEGFVLRHNSVDTCRFSPNGITTFLDEDYDFDIPALYKKTRNYIKEFIIFPDETYLDYITLWIIGTYFFMIFRYYPYVWLHAEKGSGKTLLMEILSPIAFNGSLITNPTEAVIFRDVDNNLITMFVDEVEQLRKRDKDVYGSLISIFNSGYNRSGIVKRIESNGRGSYLTKEYTTYSPKMFAGINDIDDILQDRTVRIPLLRKKDTEKVNRYKETKDILNLQKTIRDNLYIFALTYGRDIAQAYHEEAAIIEGLGHLSNRELDIWEPIFLIANIIDGQSDSTILTDRMEFLSKRAFEEKQLNNISQNETYKILAVLKIMIDEVRPIEINSNTYIFDAQEVFNYFRETEEFSWVEKRNTLTYKLKKAKVISRRTTQSGKKYYTYNMNILEFRDLCERFKI